MAHVYGAMIVLQVILTIAVIWDVRSGKIPNWLIVTGCILGIIWRIGIGGDPWYQLLLSAVFPIVAFYILFLMRALGAGDIKLLSLIGCFWPFHTMLSCVVASLVAGGIISISKLLIHRQLLESLSCFYHYFQKLYYSGKLEKYPGRDVWQRQMHFSVAIYIGFCLTLGAAYGKDIYSFM